MVLLDGRDNSARNAVLLERKAGCSATAMAIFSCISELVLYIFSASDDTRILRVSILLIFASLVGDQNENLWKRLYLHSSSIIALMTLDIMVPRISHSAHFIGAIVGIFMFFVLTPRFRGPFIIGSDKELGTVTLKRQKSMEGIPSRRASASVADWRMSVDSHARYVFMVGTFLMITLIVLCPFVEKLNLIQDFDGISWLLSGFNN